MDQMMLGIFLLIAGWKDWRSKEVSIPVALVFGLGGLVMRTAREGIAPMQWLMDISPGILLICLGYLSEWKIGLGDGVVVGVAGIIAGLENTLLLFVVSLGFCSILSGILLVCRRVGRKTRIPFIPFLAAAYGVLGLVKLVCIGGVV